MAQDATGTPTAKGIPKYNTAVDAPSGKGFNAAMDAIDGLLNYIRVRKNSGGSAYERQMLNLIEGTGITITLADDAGNNEVDVTISTSGAAGLVTALPGSPVDGQQIILTDNVSAPTYTWLLQYVSAKASNKWVFLGGTPIYNEIATNETTSSTTYTNLATTGPSVAVPIAGDYDVTTGADFFQTGNAKGRMSYAIGGTAAVDADAWSSRWGNAGNGSTNMFTKRKAGLTAVTLTAKYRVDVGTEVAHFSQRRISILPIAIGG